MASQLVTFVVSFIIFFINLVKSSATDCAFGCQIPLANVYFNDSGVEDTYYVAQCTRLLRVQSMFYCMKTHCSESEIKAGLQYFTTECEDDGFVELLPWSVISNISSQDAQAWPQVGLDYLTSEETYDTPVIVSDPLFDLAMSTSSAWSHSEVTRANYGYAMFGFFAGIFLISLSYRAINYFDHRRRRDVVRAASAATMGQSLHLALKQHLTTPALFNRHAAEPVGWCTVPLRLQSLTIAAFVVINVVLCCVSYDLFEGNLYWPNTRTQLWRYLSDRTGVIAMSNMPLIFAFAMRNNVLLWLTGWDFATFNMFHRWVSRIATIEAVLHSVGYTVECFLDGGKAEYVEQWAEQYWWMGVIATFAMSFLCIFSLYPIRKLFYEAFLILHIVLAALFLASMWYHVAIFDGQYNPFIWPCVAVWVFDRMLRYGRLAYLNLPTFKTTALYSAEANVIRITVPVRSGFKPQPGTHYYLYGLNSWKFWESHPFTLSTWESSKSSGSQQSLTFLVRPHDSFTKRLRDALIKTQTPITGAGKAVGPVRLAVEGPYGHAHSLANYNSVLLMIGGSGVSVALSHLQALHEALQAGKATGLHHVHLVWAVRDQDLFQDVHKHELAAWLMSSPLATQADFRVDVHVTNERDTTDKAQLHEPPSPSSSLSPVKPLKSVDIAIDVRPTSTSPASPKASKISMYYYRPKVQSLILDAAETWCVRGERLAVVCCGPAGMVDDTRAAVVAAYARGHEGVDLVSEVFGW